MKIRTDFVTNSSSANYCVTLKLDCEAGQHAEIRIHTYDFEPWYEDTEDGCETYDRQARALSYDADIADVSCAESVRELCEIVLSGVHEYGWGLSTDWWKRPENEPYFRNRWLRDRLLAVLAEGRDPGEVDLSEFDRDAYTKELVHQGMSFGGSNDSICKGWHFVLAGQPRIYSDHEELERYIVEHGGVLDERTSPRTDFLIYPDDGKPIPTFDDEDLADVYWTGRSSYRATPRNWRLAVTAYATARSPHRTFGRAATIRRMRALATSKRTADRSSPNNGSPHSNGTGLIPKVCHTRSSMTSGWT